MENVNKTVVVMRGIPGSGKSTYVKRNFPNAVVCSADDYHIDGDGNYNWKPENTGTAHKWCKDQFVNALEEGHELVVVDNTNTQRWELRPYVKLAYRYGYQIKVVRVRAPVKLCINRNVHDVPESAVNRMAGRFEDVPKEWNETIVSGND